MKTHYILLLFILGLTSTSIFAQKKGNRYDTTYSRKHELSVTFGTSMGGGSMNFRNHNRGNGGSFGIEYARVYKFNHFLRTGLRASRFENRKENGYFFPVSPADGDNNPDTYTQTKGTFINHSTNSFANVFVGYEYGVGLRKFRFTFGADLQMGVHAREIFRREESYQESRTLDPISGLYNYNIQFLSSGIVTGTSSNIFMALSPRLGIRRELGRRAALALTLNPQIGFSQRLKYEESVQGTRPTEYFNPKSTWFMNQNAELRLIIKLGKNS